MEELKNGKYKYFERYKDPYTEQWRPLKAIMERVGHADPETTLKIYNHVTKKSKEKVLSVLNAM